MCRMSNCSTKDITRTKSQRSFHKKVESKYLGTCRFLDHKVSTDKSQPQTVDSLRAAVYQVSVFTRVVYLRAYPSKSKTDS